MTALSHSPMRVLAADPSGGGDDDGNGLALLTLLVALLLVSASLGPTGCGTGSGGLTEPTWPDGPSDKDYLGVGSLERDDPRFQPASTRADDGGRRGVAGERELPTLAEACDLGEDADSIFFEPESSELSDEAMRTLGSIGWCLTAGPLEGLDIEVVGFTDPSPDNPAYSQALATARAQSVASYLNEIGVPATRMDIHAAGEPDLALDGDFQPVALERDQWDEVRRVLVRIDPD